MNHTISFGFFCLVLLISPGGMCLSDSLPNSIIHVQGRNTIIASESNGTSEITIHDAIPYYYTLMKNTNYLEPIQTLPDYSYPLQAALVSSDDEKEHTSVVLVEHVSLSDENKTLILQVKPLEFYEGSGLKTFAGDSENLVTGTGREVKNIRLYLEVMETPSSTYGIQDCINECVSRNNRLSACWKSCERPVDPLYK